MAQTEPLSSLALAAVEHAQDVVARSFADQVVTAEEVFEIGTALGEAIHAVQEADLARAIGVCAQRGGPDGDRFDRLMKVWEDYQEQPVPTPITMLRREPVLVMGYAGPQEAA